jgi:hypothetical protein
VHAAALPLRTEIPFAGLLLAIAILPLAAPHCTGAMTYVGNGPNFMVKAIAERSGVAMPTFFA